MFFSRQLIRSNKVFKKLRESCSPVISQIPGQTEGEFPVSAYTKPPIRHPHRLATLVGARMRERSQAVPILLCVSSVLLVGEVRVLGIYRQLICGKADAILSLP